ITRLRHPNSVRLVDCGNLDDGGAYTVLELVDGVTLSEYTRQQPMARAEARHIMGQVLDCLAAAHDLGIVHRDLKPSNIMVARVGNKRHAMVLDFGIAGMMRHARDTDYRTLTR